jgi:hypothetical protein
MADISIWQKTGHFYFALTLGIRTPPASRFSPKFLPVGCLVK